MWSNLCFVCHVIEQVALVVFLVTSYVNCTSTWATMWPWLLVLLWLFSVTLATSSNIFFFTFSFPGMKQLVIIAHSHYHHVCSVSLKKSPKDEKQMMMHIIALQCSFMVELCCSPTRTLSSISATADPGAMVSLQPWSFVSFEDIFNCLVPGGHFSWLFLRECETT